ncbi:hypothetical protein INR49_026431 [Caranx melampygus]|nr:hypothetical protein INR49_026431 [Caranx melampygus]
MCWTWLWLLASLAFSSLPCQTVGSPLMVMSAPNLLRVGTVENIFVECQGCSGGDMVVEITVVNHPTKYIRLTSTSVTLTSAQDFQGIGQIKIPAEEFSRDPTVKQYVYLQAQFPDKLLEKVVLVSFQSGYIFIQTDKTLYTPNSRLLYRMFAVTPGMEPVGRDQTTDASIDIDIMNPKGITYPLNTFSLRSGIYSGSYRLGEFVITGVWKVVAKFHSTPQQTFSAEFEVKEYVLPSFEVKLIPLSSFFYVDSESLTINIKAKYLLGERVDGTAYVVYGVMHEGRKKSVTDSVQKVEITGGEGEVILKREHITQSFNNNELLRSSIFVAVSVLTENGGEMVDAELRDIQIVTSLYTINLKKTPKYFKPGMSFDVTVEVLNPDETPAEGVPVVVEPGDVPGLTAANGMAKVTVNTMNGAASLTVTAKTDDPQISPERQASATMNALPHQTSGNNYIHIGVDTAELQLGNNLKINLNINRRTRNDITYLILSRSQLVRYGRYTTQGQVLISLIVPITKDMLPSFRIIAYYHTDANEVVSDSVWVDVKDTCMGSLRLEPSRPAIDYEPHKLFGLTVTGDPGATVGLLAVDKGVYVLNNKYRLTQRKIWDLVEKYDTGCTPGGGKDSMGVFYDAGLLFESSSGSGTPYRQELRCPLFTRSKRASTEPGGGICVSSPLEVTVKKEFFIDLRLPQSAVRGEQLEIKAIINNYTPSTITVRVELFENEHVCSAAYSRGWYRQEVRVGSNTQRIVPFIIIPLKEGLQEIEVKAYVKDSFWSDGIRKTLNVVVRERDFMLGREPFSARVEDTITLQPMERMIYQPTGNGAANMVHMTMTVIATTYLDKTNQWETVGLQKRNEALQYIQTGYQNELAYHKRDGSFSALPNLPSSSWLTAYVARVFAMAQNLVTIPKRMICDAVKFVILNAQQPNGMFRDDGSMLHGEMAGDVHGGDSDASMTAFCLIALQETRPLCYDTVNSLPVSIAKGVNYLEKRLPSLTNPYAVAMTSYALATENKLNRSILYKFASQDLSHWPSSVKHVFTLEATGYALLALVMVEAFEDARPIVRWFSSQNVGEGTESTQANLIVYQALAEYWARAKGKEYVLDVNIVLPDRARPLLYSFNRNRPDVTRLAKVKSIYYAFPTEEQSNCQKFNLTVQLLPESVNVDQRIYKLKIEVLYKHLLHDAGMSVLDISLLTGFTVNTGDLNLVPHTQPKEITFRISQTLRADVLQPAAVSIYEYHDLNCARQRKDKIENDARMLKACESTATSRTDYIYKVRVEEYGNATSTDAYKMLILDVIMYGRVDLNPKQRLRTFLSLPSCKEPLGLSVGKTYLIMGTSKDIYKVNNNERYEYILGESTWIEYWPTEPECQTEEHKDTCFGINSVVVEYLMVGCPQ